MSTTTDIGNTLPKLCRSLDDRLAIMSIGWDLVLVVGTREAGKNDAGEEFTDTAVAVEAFDSDFNFLATVGRFLSATDAMAAVPLLAGTVREAWPTHTTQAEYRKRWEEA